MNNTSVTSVSNLQSCTKLTRLVVKLNRGLGALAGWLLMATCSLVLLGILARYVFSHPLVWIDEIISTLIPLMVMLTMSTLICNNQHISIDLLVDKTAGAARQILELVRQLSHFLVAATLFFSGLSMVCFSFQYGLQSPGELTVPDWLWQLSIPLGGLLMLTTCLITPGRGPWK